MNKFFKKSSIFVIPFIILFGIVFVVDPYEYFGFFEVIPTDQKKKISYKLNYALWKVIHYKKNPYRRILLGDSRMGNFKVDKIKEISGEDYYNFSYGGGSLVEIYKTFWIASELTDLEKVYIGINLNLYNMNNCKDRVSGAVSAVENPLLYITNRDVVKAAFRLLRVQLNNNKKTINIEKPEMSRDEFWDYELKVTAQRYFSEYIYPVNMLAELEKIAEYCKEKGIKLYFVIMPTHISWQNRMTFYGLTKAREIFKSDLKNLGIVYDFDFSNEITENRENFRDPLHSKKEILSQLINEIWGDEITYCKKYDLKKSSL